MNYQWLDTGLETPIELFEDRFIGPQEAAGAPAGAAPVDRLAEHRSIV